ncbi:hypothetical protein BKA59DRAFT_460238 [Fusarium tricinctum]|uniref:Uncharacterized protein n=1 Tax=Fusarium tricinctum TaxID=61284 RepID=A0A8K0W6Q5_9HYPO|nr:hypothetical protein BKA59DRAFT_460238 [Fusarium tricinctum]
MNIKCLRCFTIICLDFLDMQLISQSIAGYLVKDYRHKYRSAEQWRLKLCTDLQAHLLVNLCNLKITPDVKLRRDDAVAKALWEESGPDSDYDYRFNLLNGKVFHWNTTILQKYLSTQTNAKRWIENRRQQARSQYRHTAPTTPPLTSRLCRHHNTHVHVPENLPYPATPHNGPARYATAQSTPKHPSLSSPLFAPPSTPNKTPTSINELVNQWATGETACDKTIKELNISPVPITPSSVDVPFNLFPLLSRLCLHRRWRLLRLRRDLCLEAKQELTDIRRVGREQQAEKEMPKFHFGMTPLDVKRQAMGTYQRPSVEEEGEDANMAGM